MFGFLVTNNKILTKSQKLTYRKYYCGLCHSLAEKYGNLGRKTLTYDFTFINMLFAATTDLENQEIDEKCPLHLLTKKKAIINEFSEYCADMNIYLTYFKLLDDVNDEKSLKAKEKCEQLKEHVTKIEKAYPALTSTIKANLNFINELEKDDILNPDLGSNAFGAIMAEILAYSQNESLKQLGYQLGKFIYLMDAVVDLKEDLKKENYNPLVMMDSKYFYGMLQAVMNIANQHFLALNFDEELKPILENIIYSGIWSQYNLHYAEGKQ